MEKARFAIVGGTGFEAFFQKKKRVSLDTPFGKVSTLYVGKISRRTLAFLPRHGLDHSVPPHRINYRANIYALYLLGIKRILATNAVGAINKNFKPYDVVIPHDFVDFTKLRASTFYDDTPVTHIDMSEPYCPDIRRVLIEKAKSMGLTVWNKGVLVCTEGPRFETPSEIAMFRSLGCDIVGMTSYPEVVLARELEMCYASICYISNMAAGMQMHLKASDVTIASKSALPRIEKALVEAIMNLPLKRENCSCGNSIRDARFK